MRVEWLLDVEKQPLTLNSHYYADYRDKFLSYYRGCRRTDHDGTLMSKLEDYKPYQKSKTVVTLPTEFQLSTAKVLSGLAELGIHGIKPTDLPKLLPSDPMEPALHIMASVRAYFQGEV